MSKLDKSIHAEYDDGTSIIDALKEDVYNSKESVENLKRDIESLKNIESLKKTTTKRIKGDTFTS
jgi:predicted RNase H-like nuclease (RuvC/YqgF family)